MIDTLFPQCHLASILAELDFPNCLLRAAELGIDFEDVVYSLLADLSAKRMKKGTQTENGDEHSFKVEVDCQNFEPNELTVKVVDGFLVIRGEKEEKEDEQGFISEQFTRRVKLSEDIQLDQIKSSLSERGVLTVTAPKKVRESPKERVIPVETNMEPKLSEDAVE